MGCTHIKLADAANIYTDEGDLFALSQLTMIAEGKTIYEKYGYEPLKNIYKDIKMPIKDIMDHFRSVRTKRFSDIKKEGKSHVDELLIKLNVKPKNDSLIFELYNEALLNSSKSNDDLADLVNHFYINLLPDSMLEKVKIKKEESADEETVDYSRFFQNFYLRDIRNKNAKLDVVDIRQFSILPDDESKQYEFLKTYKTEETDVL
jgi:hypothetical protein